MWIGTVAGRVDPHDFAEMTPLRNAFCLVAQFKEQVRVSGE